MVTHIVPADRPGCSTMSGIGFSSSRGGSSRDSPTNMTLLAYYERLRMVLCGRVHQGGPVRDRKSSDGLRALPQYMGSPSASLRAGFRLRSAGASLRSE